jgi:hypothetical protein
MGTHIKSEIEPGEFESKVFPFPDPQEVPSGRYNSVQELENAISKFEQKNGKINWANTNQRNQDIDKFLGFAVSYWINEKNERHLIGKYLYNTKKVTKGHANTKANYFHPERFDSNDLSTELGYNSTHANNRTTVPTGQEGKRVEVNLEPVNIVPDISKSYSVNDIIKIVSTKFGTSSPLTILTKEVASGDKHSSVDISNFKQNILAKSFTELLHPIALISGAYSGDKININLSNSTIQYSASAGALSDSIIKLPNGSEIFVSSKKDAGTPPAMGKNFLDLLKTAKNKNKKFAKEYQYELNLLETIASNNNETLPGDLGPLKVAIMLNIISSEEADFITNVLGANKETKKSQSTNLPNNTPKRLRQIIDNSRSYARGKISYYILMLHIMKEVCRKLNEDPKMSKAMSIILSDNFVTMMTTTSTVGNMLDMSFICKLLNAERKIKFTIETAYHSDHIKNKLQFKVL